MPLASLASGARFAAIPDEMQAVFLPAKLGLYEWTDYFFNWPHADELDIDGRRVAPLAPGVFRARWENALGLANLQPLQNGQPCDAPFAVEILSPKFPTPQRHLEFLGNLLSDLFACSSRMVWNPAGLTSRGALASNLPPSPLEALDWLLRNSQRLEELLVAILQRPARSWATFTAEIPAVQTSQLDARALVALASDGQRWLATENRSAINGFLPQRVPQTRRVASFDTPENRFAVGFIQRLQTSLRQARQSPWWFALSAEKRQHVTRLDAFLSGFVKAIGAVSAPALGFVPREARYMALYQLASSFCGVGQPLFGPTERFARLRDVASLWEFWTFFALVTAIEKSLGKTTKLEADFDESRGLLAPSKAVFESGFLVFNGPAPSYSTPLRPDFLWYQDGKALVAFDAKFRVEVETGGGRGSDLHKMHAYRDALGVTAAVALHPGTRTSWFDCQRGPQGKIPLRALLDGTAGGVGLWGVIPVDQ